MSSYKNVLALFFLLTIALSIPSSKELISGRFNLGGMNFETKREEAVTRKAVELRNVEVRFVNQWGRRGAGDGEFIIPNGITILKNEVVLVVDCRNSRVQKFDKSGNFIGTIRPAIDYKGLKPDEFKDKLYWPEGICSDKQGFAWVADTIRNHRVVQIDKDGNTLRYIGGNGNSTHGSGNDLGSFLWPHGAAVLGDGSLLAVADTGNSRVQVFKKGHPDTAISHSLDSSQLYLIHVIGGPGKELGNFSSPAGIAVDEKNEIYVADYGNNRVQVFSQEGRFLRTFGKIGNDQGEFYHPYELALSSDGWLAVSDYGNNRIQIFDRNGDILFCFGRRGNGQGEFNGPIGLAFDEERRLYVADAFNHRIQVFSFRPGDEGISISEDKKEGETAKRRMDLPYPRFSGLGKNRKLTPQELGSWLAVDVYNDSNVFFLDGSRKKGYWGRGYFDWFPPFNTWSFHPLYRESAWRVCSYIALHEITGEEEYGNIAKQALDYLVSEQPDDGVYRWWTGEEPSSEAGFFVNGVVGEALAQGFEHFKDTRYLDSLKRICDWALNQRPDIANTNYNSLLSHSLVVYYRISGESKYLEKAIEITLESVKANIGEDGAMKDAHNRKTIYHHIIVRGLIRLLSALPAEHKDHARIEEYTRMMFKSLLTRQDENGAFISSPPGAEPDKSPFIAAPVLSYCMAEMHLGWKVNEEQINAAIRYLTGGSSHHDDTFVMRDYLVYRYRTAKNKEKFKKEFSQSLKKYNKHQAG